MANRKVVLTAAAVAVASASIMGQAAAAERVAAPISGESSVGGGPIGILIVLALLGLAIGIAASDDEPASP